MRKLHAFGVVFQTLACALCASRGNYVVAIWAGAFAIFSMYQLYGDQK